LGQFPQKINSAQPQHQHPTLQHSQRYIPSFYYLLFISWYEQIKEAVVEEAEEAEINAPAVVEEAVEAVAVEGIVPLRNPIKDRPVDLDDVTLEEAAVAIKDVVAVEEDVEEGGAEVVEEVVVEEVVEDEERMKNRNQPPQRN
jgi:hypothetical protein